MILKQNVVYCEYDLEQQDDGYIDGWSQIMVHPDDTGSQHSVFPGGHPSKY